MKLVIKFEFSNNSIFKKTFLKGSVSEVRLLLVHLLSSWDWDFEYYFEK